MTAVCAEHHNRSVVLLYSMPGGATALCGLWIRHPKVRILPPQQNSPVALWSLTRASAPFAEGPSDSIGRRQILLPRPPEEPAVFTLIFGALVSAPYMWFLT